MGIGITSNLVVLPRRSDKVAVSIPNGDRHYLELFPPAHPTTTLIVSIPNGDRHYLEHTQLREVPTELGVSIPNGDRHYLEPNLEVLNLAGNELFQSPMGIGITSNSEANAIGEGATAFQSPMGIGITSNHFERFHATPEKMFQSPMGIGITSNGASREPKGSHHRVSIPNGDRHYLEPKAKAKAEEAAEFQSPMGIGITSNTHRLYGGGWVGGTFQSPMGIGITSNQERRCSRRSATGGFNPQWG